MIPDGLLSSVTPWEDFRLANLATGLDGDPLPRSASHQNSAEDVARQKKIVEAQGWVLGDDGQPHLVSASTAEIDRLSAAYTSLANACDQLRSGAETTPLL